jgi:hypothetical protein
MIKLIDDFYRWENCTLDQFIQEGNLPSQWKDYFNQEEVLKELNNISK